MLAPTQGLVALTRLRDVAMLAGRLASREVAYHLMRPTNVVLFLTYRCSSRCRTCTMWTRQLAQPGLAERELGLKGWSRFLHSIRHLRIRNIEMFGGDVLLRPDVFFPLVGYATQLGFPTDVACNGNLLTEAIARELAKTPLDAIYLSVDGVGELHDRIRGAPGNFDRLARGLETLLAARGEPAKPKVEIQCTVSALNIGHLHEILAFAVDMKVDTVYFEYVGEFPQEALEASCLGGIEPTCYYPRQRTSLLATAEQARGLKEEIRALRRSPLCQRVYVSTKNIDVLREDQLVSGLVGGGRCYVCRTHIVLAPSGHLIPCLFFGNHVLGDVTQTPFDRLWRNRARRRFIRAQSCGQLPLCRHCILSVERNPSPWLMMAKIYRGYQDAART